MKALPPNIKTVEIRRDKNYDEELTPTVLDHKNNFQNKNKQFNNPETNKNDFQLSDLPLESMQAIKHEKTEKLKREVHFIETKNKQYPKDRLPADMIKNIRSLSFRPKNEKLISQQKKKEHLLEETKIIQRQRRLNKVIIEKNNQRFLNLNQRHHSLKKFQRSEEQKIMNNKKKFNRIKEKKKELLITGQISIPSINKNVLSNVEQINEEYLNSLSYANRLNSQQSETAASNILQSEMLRRSQLNPKILNNDKFRKIQKDEIKI